MPTPASDRIRWGVACVDVQPADRLLEIGCGHGVAVTLVCDRLDDGHITAIDRSAKMVAAAHARNVQCVASGKAALVRAEFPRFDPADRRFSKIFAIHVPLFRDDPDAAIAGLRDLLAPAGTVYLIGQPLRDDEVKPWADATTDHLRAGGFLAHEPRFSNHRPVRTACVSASLPGPS